MKNFFKKYDLFKIIGLVIVLSAILTWIIPQGQMTQGKFVLGNVVRVGVPDFFMYGLLSFYYFGVVVTYLLVLGGFYGVLSISGTYQTFIKKVTKFLQGKEIAFVLITSLLLAGITSISNEVFQMLLFVPLIITIINKLKLSKMTALLTTFGSIMIGLIGATYSGFGMSAESLTYLFGLTLTSNLLAKVVLFIVTYGIVNAFNVINVRKTLKGKNKELINDKYAVDEKGKDGKLWPIIVAIVVLLAFQVLGYVAWETSFGVKVFNTFHTWLIGLKVGDHALLSYLIGNGTAFGTWDLYVIQTILIIGTFFIAIADRLKFDRVFEAFLNGAKKIIRVVLVMLFVYTVCIFNVIYPIMPTIANYITGLSKSFNVIWSSISIAIASLFNVELRYVFSAIGELLSTSFGSKENNLVIAFLFQSIHGLLQFVAPTSVFLMMGLAYLDIPFKEYFKNFWKYILILVAAIIIIICLVAFI